MLNPIVTWLVWQEHGQAVAPSLVWLLAGAIFNLSAVLLIDRMRDR